MFLACRSTLPRRNGERGFEVTATVGEEAVGGRGGQAAGKIWIERPRQEPKSRAARENEIFEADADEGIGQARLRRSVRGLARETAVGYVDWQRKKEESDLAWMWWVNCPAGQRRVLAGWPAAGGG